MTIDEAITLLKFNNKHIADLKNDDIQQLAEWLEELKFRRVLQLQCEKEYFAGYEKGKNEGYNKAIDDFAEKAKAECKVHYVDCDPYFGGIKDSILYEDDIDEIAEQLKAGGENDNLRR